MAQLDLCIASPFEGGVRGMFSRAVLLLALYSSSPRFFSLFNKKIPSIIWSKKNECFIFAPSNVLWATKLYLRTTLR
jgi:hypothetical protein